MPCDCFALAVGVCSKVELVNLLELRLEVGNLFLLVGAHHIQGCKVVFDVDTQAGPLFFFVLGGHVGSSTGEVTNVSHRGFHDVVAAQIRGDLFRFCRRLDNDQAFSSCLLLCHELLPNVF